MTVFVVFYLLCEAPVLYIQWKFGRVDMPNRFGPRILRIGAFMLGVVPGDRVSSLLPAGISSLAQGHAVDREQTIAAGTGGTCPRGFLALGVLVLLGTTLPDFTSLYVINLFLFATSLPRS